jgi:hypothetical protein
MRTMENVDFKRIYQLLVPAFFLFFAVAHPEPTIGSVTKWAGESFWHCPFLMWTGLECPGCGMTRALIAFFSRDLALSFYFNPFGPLVGFALVTVWIATLFKKDFRFNNLLRSFPQRFVFPSFLVLLTWGIARNILDL